MPRTVVPRQPGDDLRARAADEGLPRQRVAAGDTLPEKLVKYVPAETLAFFVPVAAGIGTERNALLITVVVIGAIGTLAYLWWNGQSLPVEQRPLPHFFVLALIAYFCWAIATAPNVALLLGIDALIAGVILASAVFLIPVADSVLSAWLVKKA